MNLNNQFQNIRFTKSEYQRIFRRIHKRYSKLKEAEKRDYTYSDLENLFANTSIGKELSTEIINQEIKVIKPKSMRDICIEDKKKRNQNRKDAKKKKRLKIFLASMATAGILGGAIIGAYSIDYIKKHDKFVSLYSSALVKYADYDKDGFIDSFEKGEFDLKLFKGKGLNELYPSKDFPSPTYVNGGKVPYEDMSKWLEEYKPEE